MEFMDGDLKKVIEDRLKHQGRLLHGRSLIFIDFCERCLLLVSSKQCSFSSRLPGKGTRGLDPLGICQRGMT